MSNSPLIRTAVTLCLIAATLIQPMVMVAARETCAQETCAQGGSCCQAKTVCDGCQSCEVKAKSDLRGCCNYSEDDAESCCRDQTTAKSKHDDAFREIVRGEMSGTAAEAPGVDEKIVEGETALTSCMCGTRSVPIAPAPSRVPVPQDRDLIVIAYLAHNAMDARPVEFANGSRSPLPIGNFSPHFSQRFLCIWRI